MKNIIIPVILSALLLNSCIFNKMDYNKLKAEYDSLIVKKPENCEDGIELHDDILDIQRELIYAKGNSNGINSLINYQTFYIDKLKQTLEADPNCIDACKYIGDYDAAQAIFTNARRISALHWYYRCAEFNPDIDEINLRIGYIYDLFDQPDSAKKYYLKIEEPEVLIKTSSVFFPREMIIPELIDNIKEDKTLDSDFLSSGEDSYILFRRTPTFFKNNEHSDYMKIYPGGLVEFNGNFGDGRTGKINLHLKKNKLNAILQTLKKVRFLSMYNLLRISPDYDFIFDPGPNLPVYRLTYKIPDKSHSVRIYGLMQGLENENKKAERKRKDTTAKKDESYVSDKLSELGRLWSECFSDNIILDSIQERYGQYELPFYGPDNYLFLRKRNSFVKIGMPDFNIFWETPKNSKPEKNEYRAQYVVIFRDGSMLYSVDKDRGLLMYKLKWDEKKYPYIYFNDNYIYMGRSNNNNLEIVCYRIKSGDKTGVFTRGSDNKIKITEGDYTTSYQEPYVKDQFGKLIEYIKRNSK